jgi:hypothetical protein
MKASQKNTYYAMNIFFWKSRVRLLLIIIFVCTYLACFIHEGVAETSPTLLQDPTFYQNYLAMRNTADVTGGKPIAA